MKERLSNLLTIKSIVTILMTLAFIYQAIRGELDTSLLTIYTTVIAFYFGTQTEKKSKTDEVTTTAEAIVEDATPTAIEEPTVTLYNNTAEEPEQTAEETEK